MRKWLIGGAVVVLAAIALAFRPTAIEVETVEVRRGPLEETLDHEGRTRVRDRYAVHAPLSGSLRRVTLEEGDPVVAGTTVVATIDPPPPHLLDPRAEEQARGRVGAAQAALDEARGRLEQAEEQRRIAELDYVRIRDLSSAGDASTRERDLAEKALRLWEGDARRAAAAVRVAEADLEVARAALLRSSPAEGDEVSGPAERALAVRSPVDGQVLRVHRESAGPTTVGEPLLELGDVDALEIVADYLTTDAVRIEPGLPARLHGFGLEDTIPALVRRVEPSGYTKISALGVEEQRVDVVLDLEDPASPSARRLRDGYRVEVSVVAWSNRSVLQVPEGALFRSGDDWACFRAEEGRAVLTPVRVGHRDGRSAEVLEGLRDGETVIVHPPDAVADGGRVTPR